jgi:hypothetical protein
MRKVDGVTTMMLIYTVPMSALPFGFDVRNDNLLWLSIGLFCLPVITIDCRLNHGQVRYAIVEKSFYLTLRRTSTVSYSEQQRTFRDGR